MLLRTLRIALICLPSRARDSLRNGPRRAVLFQVQKIYFCAVKNPGHGQANYVTQSRTCQIGGRHSWLDHGLNTWPYALGLVLGVPCGLLGRLHDELPVCRQGASGMILQMRAKSACYWATEARTILKCCGKDPEPCTQNQDNQTKIHQCMLV